MSDVLLLSGGLDSAAIAAWHRPAHCRFVDYGQRSARGEARAATAVARELQLSLDMVSVDLSKLGAGIMSHVREAFRGPQPVEWWPYRNQFLATIGAAYAVRVGGDAVAIGTTRDDAQRFTDGSPAFVDLMDALLGMQEGGIRFRAPGAELTTAELIRQSGIADAVLGWTQSCHLSDLACGGCPGCRRRAQALKEAGRLQP